MRPIDTADRMAYTVVCCSVSLSLTTISPAKMAEPIEISFGLWTRVGARNYVLDVGSLSTHEKGHLQGGDIGIFPHAAEHCSQWPWH